MMPRCLKVLFLLATMLPFLGASKAASPKSKKTNNTPSPQIKKKSTFEDIIRQYNFVADFTQKDPERPNSDELFWRYPWTLQPVTFPIIDTLQDPAKEFPPTLGSGRAVQHLNRGRAYYMQGNFDEARTSWLSARARFGKDYPFHRRNDYFIGQVYLRIAKLALPKAPRGFNDVTVITPYNNASTFLSWAFLVKKDVPDPLVEEVAPKGIYNLASIYYRYSRYAGSFAAAEQGLDFLRRTGRKEFRIDLHRLVAEGYIKNHSYLEAVQEFDTALRQNPKPTEAANMFVRVGDIYFDLNNYELAEDAYKMAAEIDEELHQLDPTQLVLRGESLFWLGKFSDAQKAFHMALEGVAYRKDVSTLDVTTASYARLRLADAWMALKKYDEAKLAYFKVEHEYRGTEAARVAAVRRGCLELPFYYGNNVRHAREIMESAKAAADIPEPAKELAWACHVSSYADRERTKEMVERVRTFADRYPQSRFLRSLAEPIREVQASQIEAYFESNRPHSAISFFERNRKTLFPKVSKDLRQKLFVAYANAFRSDLAAEFWDDYDSLPVDDWKLLRQTVVAAELQDAAVKGAHKNNQALSKRFHDTAAKLEHNRWSQDMGDDVLDYIARLRASPVGLARLGPWILSRMSAWAEDDTDFACTYEYPLFAQLAFGKPQLLSGKAQREHLSALVSHTLPQTLEADESCASSILDTEARVYDQDIHKLTEFYLERQNWKLSPPLAAAMWTVAERAYSADLKDAATALWKTLRDRGPSGSPEVGFAKARLDPTQTQFEKLWN